MKWNNKLRLYFDTFYIVLANGYPKSKLWTGLIVLEKYGWCINSLAKLFDSNFEIE